MLKTERYVEYVTLVKLVSSIRTINSIAQCTVMIMSTEHDKFQKFVETFYANFDIKPLGENKDGQVRYPRPNERLYKIQEEAVELAHAISKFTKWEDTNSLQYVVFEMNDLLKQISKLLGENEAFFNGVNYVVVKP